MCVCNTDKIDRHRESVGRGGFILAVQARLLYIPLDETPGGKCWGGAGEGGGGVGRPGLGGGVAR